MIQIEECLNGFVGCSTENNEYLFKTVFSWKSDDAKDKLECVADLLEWVKNELGYQGSKHDKCRIRIIGEEF